MVSDFHQKSFPIKHEDTKFFSNKLESNNKLAIPSFRIYYGDNVPSSVPFIWESQPGTPKHELSQISHYLPPLTPPPSYYSNNINTDKQIPTRKNSSRSKLFHTLIKKLTNPKKPHYVSCPSSSSSLSGSSSSHSSFSAPATPSSNNLYRRRPRSGSRGGSYSFDDEVSGKLSAACGGHQAAAAGVFMMKKALFSVLSGRRSS
ncbi:hypothetical protein HAX54_026505 [Datura stramonium]|uniref:Uncharacterized protein n=1 Tax=Datura stramonium TaxID=4076 RepID=A0ABS8S7V7_DATST|nr:hypothetical protein [Datura stramonium]